MAISVQPEILHRLQKGKEAAQRLVKLTKRAQKETLEPLEFVDLQEDSDEVFDVIDYALDKIKDLLE
jgi:hypothetical protein